MDTTCDRGTLSLRSGVIRLILSFAVVGAAVIAASSAGAQETVNEYVPVLGQAEINPGGAGYVPEAPPSAPIVVPRMEGPANYVGAPAPPAGAAAAPAPRFVPGPSAPPLGASFQGIAYTWFYPPDPIMAAGPSDLVAVVNGGIALFTKAGVNALQRTLDNFYNGSLSGTFTYDPKILYDPHTSRFFTVALDGQSSPSSWLRIAVSKSNNPNNLNVGAAAGNDWWGFNIDADLDGGVQANNNWADYPGLGVDQYNLYITCNMFSNAGAFQYSKVWIIPKAGLLAGGPITIYEFGAPPALLTNPATGFVDFTIMPAINFDLTNEHMLATNALGGPNGWVTVWTVNTPAGIPTLASVNLMVAGWNSWTVPDCPQSGGGNPIDTGSTRMLHVVERNGSIWATHTQPDPGGTRTEARWYEINPVGPAVVQFGQVTDPTRCYFFPAIQPDAAGDVCLVMSGVDATIFGSTFYTGRLATALPGTMQAVAPLKMGSSNYVILDGLGRNRWGDFGGISEDPVTGNAWMFHEYASSTADQWSTWFGECALTTFCGDGIIDPAAEACDPAAQPAGCAQSEVCTPNCVCQAVECQIFPPAGSDFFETIAEVTVEVLVPPINDTVELSGPTSIERGDPVDPGDGRREIATEIISLALTSGTTAFGILRMVESPTLDSLGMIKAQASGTDFPADSWFDIFFEIETDLPPPLDRLHNTNPLRMEQVINCIPPVGTIYMPEQGRPQVIPLFDTSDTHVATLTHAQHSVVNPLCGDGFVDPFEECDDGNLLPGDGCDENCKLVCPAAPLGTCRVPGKSKLILQDKTPDRRDKVLWKWVRGAATDAAEFGDPVNGNTSYALCIYHAGGLLMQLLAPADGICGGRPCWKAIRSFLPPAPPPILRGYKFKDKARANNGVGKVLLKGGVDGKAKVLVKAKKENVPDPGLGLSEPVTVELINNSTLTTGICWGDTYSGSEIKRNDAEVFKAKAR